MTTFYGLYYKLHFFIIFYQLSCLGLDDDVEHLKQKTPLSVGSTAILYHVLLAETYVKMPALKTEKLETERKHIKNYLRNPANFGESGSHLEVHPRGDFQSCDILVKSKLDNENP